MYDVQFFNRYFEDREVRDIQALENLQEDFQTFREEQHKEKVSAEEIEEAFETFKKKRDAVREFEVELAENQIEKLVDKGVYIKVSFGVKQSGLIFIPNYQLDIMEK
ncbi:relaxase [Streptococcus pneumoniae]|nr:relaxase [Streptococcus pneumoniae]